MRGVRFPFYHFLALILLISFQPHQTNQDEVHIARVIRQRRFPTRSGGTLKLRPATTISKISTPPSINFGGNGGGCNCIHNVSCPATTHKRLSDPLQPREVRGWGLTLQNSQVSGVAVDNEGNPVIFHRGSRFYNSNSYNSTEHFQHPEPILEAVVLTLSRESGQVTHSWGAGLFYLPHGITIDSQGNTWLTDVGSHQVFKFSPKSTTSPSLTKGVKLEPGNDKEHFCKPTSVAVASSGDFFVADGYCNARILQFSPDGSFKGQHGSAGDNSALDVPHGLSLNEALDILCIADREHGRTACIRAGLSKNKSFGDDVASIQEPNHIRVFDVAFVGNCLVGVGGSENESMAIGFTANLEKGAVVNQWEPVQGFQNPHSIAVDEKRMAIYVTENGPNRIWKFILDETTGGAV